eukprot:CAMPEP_0206183186 /NCGR_PEP_ID=MMETSP0166-20121206/490_1 /ASSEMBLY_ACC=CAM_ASM_000260 /TAXON_ID=95228 /ORGANISM="Vannella robusta, Strain DIVA3 518/3/11/1/6" /LENGTH=181 /DNA_ID=CAMNT_0053597997 /DNA_START=104 /DNA_END=649 /DNA_ORIENTATION=+
MDETSLVLSGMSLVFQLASPNIEEQQRNFAAFVSEQETLLTTTIDKMNSILQCLIKQREIYGNIDTSRAHLRDLWKQSSEFLAHAVAGDKKIEKREKGLVIATMEEIAKLESLSNHFQNSGSSKGLLKPAMKYMNSISGPMEEFINSLDEQHQNFDKQEKILENCSQLVRKLNNTELTKHG